MCCAVQEETTGIKCRKKIQDIRLFIMFEPMISALQSIQKKIPLLKNEGVQFILKFLFFVIVIHYLNELVIGLAAPGGLYLPFVEQHLNYIAVWRTALLKVSSALLHLFHYDHHLLLPYRIQSASTGHTVTMVYSCIGYGVTGVWIAFVLAFRMKIISKLIWAIAGSAFLFLLNCVRINAILVLGKPTESFNNIIDHHDLFNLFAYAFIFGMMYLLIKKSKTRMT